MENGLEGAERQRDESGDLAVPQIGDDAGLHYDDCERERTVLKQREFKEVGLRGLS